MELLKRVAKKSSFIVLPAIVIAFFFESRKMPLGIFFGWLFGIFNLRALTRNVEGLVGSEKAAVGIVMLNLARLLTVSTAIFMLVYYKVVNIFGLIAGFTVVLALILLEGVKVK
ncbi:MAG: ATP synthase subunit I [Nitrospirae bacterium]|nr:ATP synthase subunit I [Nitrospirota bacterium]